MEGCVVVKAISHVCAVVILAAFAVVVYPLAVSARVHNDYIVVLDTSYSMAGQGGRDIFNEAKNSLDSYIDRIQKGDSLTFITFDTTVRIYPTVMIDTQNSRDIVKKYLSVLEAKGAWTYTVEMLRNLIRTADDLHTKDPSRQQVIVIMTDAIDDPPPAKRNDRIDIKSLAKAKGNDWFIYLVDIGDLEKNPQMQKLATDLTAVSKYTQIVDSKAGIQRAVDAMSADAEKKSAVIHRPFFLNPAFIIAVLAVIIVLVVLYLRMLSRIKLNGILEYWSNDTFHKDVFSIDLAKYNLRKLAIGKDGDVMIRLRDFSSRKPLLLEAVSIGGKIHPAIVEAASAAVEFIGEKSQYLVDGLSFKSGAYTFVYHEKK
jgi:Mg-chelatase subunit ChlD